MLSEPIVPAAPIPFRRLLVMPWRWSRWTLALTLAATFLMAYGASYVALADKAVYVVASSSNFVTMDIAVPSVYYPRIEVLPSELQQAVGLFFVPAHRLDRWMRPNYWGGEWMSGNSILDDAAAAHEAFLRLSEQPNDFVP